MAFAIVPHHDLRIPLTSFTQQLLTKCDGVAVRDSQHGAKSKNLMRSEPADPKRHSENRATTRRTTPTTTKRDIQAKSVGQLDQGVKLGVALSRE